VVAGDAGYLNTLVLTAPDGHRYATPVLLACTGLGSTAIVAGLVFAVGGSLRRKAQALAVAVPVIYALNLGRIVFIVLAHAEQWFRVRPLTGVVMTMFGTDNPKLVSYYFADKVLAQSLSVVALVLIGWAVVRVIPELSVVLEELSYLLTGEEYDLRETFARSD
jgi:archaeosortase A (PGF-CTERM-specific)